MVYLFAQSRAAARALLALAVRLVFQLLKP